MSSSLKMKSLIGQIDPNALKIAQQIAKKDEEMKPIREKLDKLRLQEESQNTKLIRIQQDERKANDEYKQKKRDMEKILEELALRAERFNEEQKKIYEDLEAKKDPVILKNDTKKKQEEEKFKRDSAANQEKKEQIKLLNQEKEKNANELKDLEKDLSRYRKYEDFLKSANESTEESKNSEKSIMELINRYEKLKKNQIEFGQLRESIEKEKDQVNYQIATINKEMEDASYHFTSSLNELKNQIDVKNQEIRKLEAEIEGKFSVANSKQSEYGRILLAIKNLDIRSKNALLTKEQAMKQVESEKNAEKFDFAEETDKIVGHLDEIKKRVLFLMEVQANLTEVGKSKDAKTLEKSIKLT